jgi:hypothetical protein
MYTSCDKEHGEDTWELMKPLTHALENDEHDLIISALFARSLKIISDLKSKESEMECYFKLQAKEIVCYLAFNPEYYEMDHLNKTDLMEIMEYCFPNHYKKIPNNTRSRSDWWGDIPYLNQNRGRSSEMHPNLKVWTENWKKRIRSGEIRFDPDGTMHMGSFKFHDARQIVDAAQRMPYNKAGSLVDS